MPGDPLLARPSAESVLPTRGRRGDSASKCVSPSPQRRADSAIGRAGWGTAPADLAVLARAEAFAHRTSAARTSLPPLAKRVAGRADSGEARAGWGVLPQGASSTSGAGVDGSPGPTTASFSSPSRLAQPSPTPTPPRQSASPRGGREEREADMGESGRLRGEADSPKASGRGAGDGRAPASTAPPLRPPIKSGGSLRGLAAKPSPRKRATACTHLSGGMPPPPCGEERLGPAPS